MEEKEEGASEVKRVTGARAAAGQAQGTKASDGGRIREETQTMEATE
jgi:hypothetical protein